MLTIKNQVGKSLILILTGVTLFAGCGQPGPRALLKGKKLLEQGKYEQALEKLQDATVLLATNAQAFNYLGVALHQTGKTTEADKAYHRALNLNPDLSEAHYNLGCLWLAQNKPEQAKLDFTAYTMRRPNDVEGWLKLGATQLRSREIGAAEKSYNEALRVSPQNLEALNGLGMARVKRDRAVEAVQFFTRALKQQPKYGPALLNLAIVTHQDLGNRQLALEKYREYLALKPVPENAEAVRALVSQLERELAPPRPSVPQSQPALQAQAQPNPSTLPATNSLKTALVEPSRELAPPRNPMPSELPRSAQGQKTETASAPQKSPPQTNATKAPVIAAPPEPTPVDVVKLSAEPTLKAAQDMPQPSAPAQTSQVLQANNANAAIGSPAVATPAEPKPAKRGFLQKINPKNLFSSDDRKPAINQVAQADTAVSLAEPATNSAARSFARYTYLNPPRPASGNHAEAERSFSQGVQAHQAQRLPDALQAYRRATQLDPGYFDAHYNLALASTQTGNVESALGSYEVALALRPESSDARYNFALLLKQSNYPVDAANELEKVVAAYPNDSRAHLALGNLYAQQLGQNARARQNYLKVLEADPRNPQAGPIRFWLTQHPK